MGKATRWLKALLGMKKEKEKDNFDTSSSVCSTDKKDRKRWSFGKSGFSSGRYSAVIPQNQGREAAWIRSYISETEKEQNKHAIAVAAATAAAADAAVAAAQAAVAVVRLTSQGRGTLFGGGKERCAALTIQTLFRGFLARKALRALKALVKLQALVRGYLVRKQATATLLSMQALIRAQTSVRTQRARRSFNKENRFLHPENRARKSVERFEDTGSEFHSKKLSTSLDIMMNTFGESPKIVEIDTYKPRSGSHRISSAFSECGEELPYSSPLPCQIPNRIAIPDCGKYQDFDWCFNGDECRFSTAHSTPRFSNSIRSNAPATPAKSVCGYNYFRPYTNYPNYMANTQSFKAKLRSHSTPKQRPEPRPKKKLSLDEIMASRNSISGIRMQRSFAQVEETYGF